VHQEQHIDDIANIIENQKMIEKLNLLRINEFVVQKLGFTGCQNLSRLEEIKKV
jgi:hypothetical protein